MTERREARHQCGRGGAVRSGVCARRERSVYIALTTEIRLRANRFSIHVLLTSFLTSLLRLMRQITRHFRR